MDEPHTRMIINLRDVDGEQPKPIVHRLIIIPRQSKPVVRLRPSHQLDTQGQAAPATAVIVIP